MTFNLNSLLDEFSIFSGQQEISAVVSNEIDYTMNIQKPKYPIVLVHGFGFNADLKKILPALLSYLAKINLKINLPQKQTVLDYWGAIPDLLKKAGIDVHEANPDAFGFYESNAELLQKSIESFLQKTNAEKVNIIAHSKGGIDSRFLLTKESMQGKVASLTTIATPHQGAEFADIIFEYIDGKDAKQSVKLADLFLRLIDIISSIVDKDPNIKAAGKCLTTEHMKEFNRQYGQPKGMYFKSYYASISDTENLQINETLYKVSCDIIKKRGGANDGLVSEVSANWGDNTEKIEGSFSHSALTDRISDPNSPKKKVIYAVYEKIVNELAANGY